MTTNLSNGGFTFSINSVGGVWSWAVQANNIQGSNQLYQVADIQTPFGAFVNASIPLPGDVVLAMSDTLQQFQSQLSPHISLLSPGTTTFSQTVTEGDASFIVATVPFQNSGAFGSFLTATATPDSPWLQANPPVIAGLNKNDQGQFSVKLIPAALLAISSPYTGHVNLQDNAASPTTVPLTFTITVLPRPAIATDVTAVSLSYALGTGTPSGAQSVNVSNSGPAGSLLNAVLAKVQNRSPWLAFVPATVGPLVHLASSTVTFSVVPGGVPAIPGTYTETILISSTNASNSPVTVVVTLVVSP